MWYEWKTIVLFVADLLYDCLLHCKWTRQDRWPPMNPVLFLSKAKCGSLFYSRTHQKTSKGINTLSKETPKPHFCQTLRERAIWPKLVVRETVLQVRLLLSVTTISCQEFSNGKLSNTHLWVAIFQHNKSCFTFLLINTFALPGQTCKQYSFSPKLAQTLLIDTPAHFFSPTILNLWWCKRHWSRPACIYFPLSACKPHWSTSAHNLSP